MHVSHERILYMVNRPLVIGFAELIRGIDCLSIPRLGYIVNDPQLASDILLHPNFTSSGHGAMGGLITPLVGEYGLFNMDGEKHQTFKRLLMKIFTRQYVETIISATLPPMLNDLRRRLCDGKTVDFAAFTNAMTTRIMLHMLGIDVTMANIEPLAQAVNQAVLSFTMTLELSKTKLDAHEMATVQQHITNLNALIDEHGRYQEGALLFRLRDVGLSDDEARGLMLAILAAGTETTNATLPRILALLLDTRQYAILRDDRSLMPNTIDEGIRVTSASPAIIRAIEADTTIGDYTFDAGKRAVLLLYNMMKHPKYLDEPRKFDIHREIPTALKHLSFGRGAHFCLGFMLAHREIEVTLNTLLDLPHTPLIVSRKYPRGQTFPGYTELNIRF